MSKEKVRKSCLKKLRSLPFSRRYVASKKTNIHIAKLLKKISKGKKRILFYLPMSHEVDLRPTMNKMRKNNDIFVPALEHMKFKMVEYRLPLVLNKYKIKEPKSAKNTIKSVDIMIVPVIAIDRVFRRVGFGKGMYDRFFASLKSKPIVIFTMPVLCYSKNIITKNYDIRGDFFVSSMGILHKESKHEYCRNNYRLSRYWHNKRSDNVVSSS